jgi:hypothetical protein
MSDSSRRETAFLVVLVCAALSEPIIRLIVNLILGRY